MNLYQRFHEHKSQSNHPDSGHACAIHRAIHENGLDEFEMVLIENFPCTNVSELRVREQYYMNLFKPEYNVFGAIHDKEKQKKNTRERHTKLIKCTCGQICSYGNISAHRNSRQHILQLTPRKINSQMPSDL